ncbi:MAG: cadmium-translocating P-type ATPase [Clostridia bacterium]|nr:cadmium-translocating P-type ATPase [Clostridia bacterium]
MTKKEKVRLRRIIISASVFIAVLALDKIFAFNKLIGGRFGFLLPLSLYFAIYIYIGYDVLLSAAKNIVNGQVFDEKFLMAIASLGAIALAVYNGISGNGPEGAEEACAVMILYKLGNFFEHYATGKSRNSIKELMKLRPDEATVIRNGEKITVSPEEVKLGEIILVTVGERIPLDGVIVSGATSLDCKALTGESLPVDVKVGDEVLSGSVNMSSVIEIKVVSEFHNSTVSKILELIENASSKKSKTENFITKFAKYYTPTVVISALLLAIVPSLITGDFAEWIYRALNFLVVSCPCALVISVPLAFVSGMGSASRRGILVKGGNSLEIYDKANVFVFDKTGTLTEGNFDVASVCPKEKTEEILRAAATAEKFSTHPIALSIVKKYGKETEDYSVTEISGKGVSATKGEDKILCGNLKFMNAEGIFAEEAEEVGTVVYVAKNGEYLGYILISDKIKQNSAEVIKKLGESGIKTAMLTGDREEIASFVAEKLGVSYYKSGLLPADKVEEVESLKGEGEKNTVCFVGDGINDAPVMVSASVAVAMGGLGSDAAIEAADVVLMKDDLSGLTTLKRISKKTLAVVRENVYGSIGVKIAILLLSAFGLTGMWLAILGDVGVATVAILNSMRLKSAGKPL